MTLSTIERTKLLRTVNLFADMPEDVLERVAAVVEEADVAPEERIIVKGALETTMYIVVEGQVRVHNDDNTIVALTSRDVFGELSALDPAPRSASVTAVTACHLLRLEHDALMDLMANRFEVARSIIQFLCRRYRQNSTRERPAEIKVTRALRALDAL